MRVNGRLAAIGVFFISFGVVLLGARQGWIPGDVVDSLGQLWPVLLIALGLALVLAGRPWAWLAGALAAACLGAMAAGVVEHGVGPFVGCGGEAADEAFASQTGRLASPADVDVTFSCGELDVASVDGSSWALEGGNGDGRSPSVDAAEDHLRVEPASTRSFLFGGHRESWRLTLPSEPTIRLGVTLNAGSGRLDLDAAHLSDVDFTVNAGSLAVDLRGAAAADGLNGTVNAGSNVTWLPELPLQGDLTVNAGSLSICAPPDLGLRFHTGSLVIASNNFEEAGLVRIDDGWQTPGYATAPIRTELDVSANAGSVALNPTEPCRG
jgi:hypothetical protein